MKMTMKRRRKMSMKWNRNSKRFRLEEQEVL